MGKLSQAQRLASFKSPLGEDVLVLTNFSGTEELGHPFELQIDALSEQENLDFDQALGQSCTVSLKTYQNTTRYFNGIMVQAQWTGTEIGDQQNYSRYRMVLRPWYWLLAHRADCRIFLEKDVKEIIQDVFEKAGFASGTDFIFKTTGSYDKIKYCVQYRETDFAFTSRLMEQFGIYYYFEHSQQRHTMILADSRSSHSPIPDLPKLAYHVQIRAHNRKEQQINSWTSERRFRTGRIEFNDYDYLKPPKKLRANKEASEKYAKSKFEVYDYPGKYDEQDKGTQFAQFRLEAEQSFDHRRMSDGEAPSLFAGGLVTVDKHPTEAENKEYLVLRADHHFGHQYYGTTSGDTSMTYQGSYAFLPSDRPFRSLPLAPKPRIYGIQTAKVVVKKGDDGEEISTDENGHIWVQFHWDREPQKSCPIRVAHVWSSKQWGGQFIPRVGMEVVVEFLEGDPDRPLVTGCVYNGDNKHPYTLPDNKTQSGVKSDSSKGPNQGYNEFMFEDQKDSEKIGLHAEKDYELVIRHAETRTIGETFGSGTSRDTTLKNGDDKLDVQNGSQHVTISEDQTIEVQKTIEVTANTSIELKVGTSKILLEQSGITIDAPTVTIKSLGAMTINGTPISIN
jgi:type VI secretion system secreted protein VgrG